MRGGASLWSQQAGQADGPRKPGGRLLYEDKEEYMRKLRRLAERHQNQTEKLSQKRIKMVATSARVAFPVGLIAPLEP